MYLDGELCGIGDDGLPSFSQTQAASDVSWLSRYRRSKAKQTSRTPREPPIGCWFWPTCERHGGGQSAGASRCVADLFP